MSNATMNAVVNTVAVVATPDLIENILSQTSGVVSDTTTTNNIPSPVPSLPVTQDQRNYIANLRVHAIEYGLTAIASEKCNPTSKDAANYIARLENALYSAPLKRNREAVPTNTFVKAVIMSPDKMTPAQLKTIRSLLAQLKQKQSPFAAMRCNNDKKSASLLIKILLDVVNPNKQTNNNNGNGGGVICFCGVRSCKIGPFVPMA